MAFIRKIKKGEAIYLAKVESYREDGKVKQRVLEYVGKEENGLHVQKVDIIKTMRVLRSFKFRYSGLLVG